MSVQFVLGRAGTGKTAYCLHAVADRLAESAAEGDHLFLLVPEQASMQMERALLAFENLNGFARCEVLSFRRLARRVLEASGGAPRTLSPTARQMAIRKVLRALEDRLIVLGGRRGRRGVVARVSACLDELIAEDVSPGDLLEAASRLNEDQDLLASRLHDLHAIYDSYLTTLGEDRVDPGQHLIEARRRLDALPGLCGGLIWVDGFAGLTRQEHLMLIELARRAGRMEISLLVDPNAETLRGESPIESSHLFARTERTYHRLCHDLREAGIELEPPRTLTDRPPRFAGAPLLARLERDLFSWTSAPAGSDEGRDAPNGTVQLIQAATRRVEVDAAVAKIRQLAQREDSPLRYREIAVIVRDLEPYADLLTSALSAAGIPFFLDRRRPILHHAATEFVRSVLAVGRSMDIENVSALVKTGLAGLSEEEIDLLENYLLAHGVRHRSQWSRGEWTYRRRASRRDPDDVLSPSDATDLATLNRLRERLVEGLTPWWALTDREHPPTAREWAVGLFGLLDAFDVPAQLAGWSARAEQDGRLDEANEHREVWKSVVTLLDDLAEAFPEQPMTLGDVEEIVDTALADSTLGLTPPTIDQVLVGSIERSRHPAIRAALVLGFSDGDFPRRIAQDPILPDAERRSLARVGLELAPTSRQQLFDEQLLAYIALTRPNAYLWISWPAAETDGRVRQPSPYLQAIRAVLPEVRVQDIAEPRTTRETWMIGSPEDLAGAVAADLRERTRQTSSDPEADRRWNTLYDHARRSDLTKPALRHALASLGYDNRATLTPEAVSQLHDEPYRTSVSQLETFAACPFQHFAKYGLRLEPRDAWVLDVLDLGTICHRLLQDYVQRLIATGRRLADVPADEIPVLVQDLTGRVLEELVDELTLSDPRNAYLLERAGADVANALDAQRAVSEAGLTRPVGVEVTFGIEGAIDPNAGPVALPALTVQTPLGRTVTLGGKIDRVDLAEVEGRLLAGVVDYKRGAGRTLRLDHVVHGLDLQLLSYLLVIAEHGERLADQPVQPAAAFYASLIERLEAKPAPPEATSEAPDRADRLKPRGLLDWDSLVAYDSGLGPGGRSKAVAAEIRKDGEPSNLHRTDVAEHRAFQGLLGLVRAKLGELCDRILDGVVEVSPYELGRKRPCAFCPYAAFCRFEFDTHRPRRLESIQRKTVLQEVLSDASEVSDG